MIPLKYMVRRVAFYLVTIYIATTVVFIIPRLIPGDPIEYFVFRMTQQGNVIPEGYKIVEEYRRKFGLDADIYTQYVNYLKQIFSGTLGPSILNFPMTVEELIGDRILWTIGLLFNAVIISWTLGNLLGALLGWKRGSKLTSAIAGACLFLSQIPYYILALVLALLFVYYIPLFPIGGAYRIGLTPSLNPQFIISVVYHSFLPALSIVLSSLGGWAVGMRAMIIGIQGEDYITFAESKGLTKNTILMKYGFRNAMLPSVTGLAMSLGGITSGALLTEWMFSYPGIGSLFIRATAQLDYNVLQGVLIVVIFTVLTANLLIDLLYPVIDPRIRYEVR
ncbi:MAG: ABC transporter permease [Candidatus Bathyarchaeia archaeon]